MTGSTIIIIAIIIMVVGILSGTTIKGADSMADITITAATDTITE